MSPHTIVLRIASIVLPRHHRARWREEASAVLMEVSGGRRFWYTLDTVVKVPLLAWEHRRGQAGAVPVHGRKVSAVVGAALLVSALAMTADVFRPLLTREPDPIGIDVFVTVSQGLPVIRVTNFLGYLVAMGGLLVLVFTRSFRLTRRGRELRYADSAALLLTAFVAAGPLIGLTVSFAMGLPAVAVAGAVLPGVWLTAVSVLALRRRAGPLPLALLGTVAGLALIGVLGPMSLGQRDPLVLIVGGPALLVAAPTYLLWSVWAGVRLLFGRQDLLVPRPADALVAQPADAPDGAAR